MNIQGLAPQTVQSKVPFITDIIQKQLFFGLSETWLKDHKDAELDIDGYTLYRSDSSRKKKSRGRYSGGVAFYVRDDIAISSEPILIYSTSSVQLLCLYSKVENLVLACLYRQPDDSVHGNPSTPADLQSALNRFMTAIDGLQPAPDIILGGDFNLPGINWRDCTPAAGATKDEKSMLNLMNEMCNELLLTQIVNSPTHKDGNTLDLVFVKNTLHVVTKWCFRRFLANFFQSVDVVWSSFVI